MTEQFYDVVDSEGNVVETAEQQKQEAQGIPLERVQPKLSLGEVKKLRRQYVTVTHPRVVECKHKLDLHSFPRTNCESCLFTWFNSHGELCQQMDEMHTAGSDNLIIQLQGVKFYQQWRKFMSTVANLKKLEEVNNGI